MKRILLTAMAALTAVFPCLAQRDIKTLNNKTAAQVRSILGTPSPSDFIQEDFPDIDHLEYDRGATVIEIVKNSPQISYFGTTSANYRVLSDYVKGGFKVGDSLSRLRTFDFAGSPYGRDKPGNALVQSEDPEWYYAYQEEGYVLKFQILKSKVVKIVVRQPRDMPSPDYKNTNCPFE